MPRHASPSLRRIRLLAKANRPICAGQKVLNAFSMGTRTSERDHFADAAERRARMRNAVFVVRMTRSGSSALARILRAADRHFTTLAKKLRDDSMRADLSNKNASHVRRRGFESPHLDQFEDRYYFSTAIAEGGKTGSSASAI